MKFQSTLPARGATRKAHGIAYRVTFQSTLPARGATQYLETRKFQLNISIHAPRTGSDKSSAPLATTAANFNPRSPHGERRIMAAIVTLEEIFQSTLPARGATTST